MPFPSAALGLNEAVHRVERTPQRVARQSYGRSVGGNDVAPRFESFEPGLGCLKFARGVAQQIRRDHFAPAVYRPAGFR